jgi:four helix bundle protein
MHNFKELIVWQKSRMLVKQIYLLTQKFPVEERFGLVQQIRRAVISIPSNIAEGSGRGTNIDFSRFLDIARGSAFEVETQLILSSNLEYITQEDLEKTNKNLQEIEKLICKFAQSIRKTKV